MRRLKPIVQKSTKLIWYVNGWRLLVFQRMGRQFFMEQLNQFSTGKYLIIQSSCCIYLLIYWNVIILLQCRKNTTQKSSWKLQLDHKAQTPNSKKKKTRLTKNSRTLLKKPATSHPPQSRILRPSRALNRTANSLHHQHHFLSLTKICDHVATQRGPLFSELISTVMVSELISTVMVFTALLV